MHVEWQTCAAASGHTSEHRDHSSQYPLQRRPPTFTFTSLLKVYADTSVGDEPPYLYLSGTRGVDSSSGLPAVPRNASSTDSSVSAEITFVYTVEFGDTTSGAVLEVDTRSAVRDGDAPLVDLLGREANVTLPETGSDATLSETAAVSIDSAEPFVVGVGSSLVGGEYGVGQVRAKGGHTCIPGTGLMFFFQGFCGNPRAF